MADPDADIDGDRGGEREPARFDPDRPQTPGQWAVRWHGLVLLGALLLSVPIVHVLWHGVLGHDAPMIRVRSQVEPPALAADAFFGGEWAVAEERYLREASPVVWQLRGAWSELRYELGIYRTRAVHAGADGWFYSRVTLAPSVAFLDRHEPARRAFYRALRARTQQLGLELVVAIVPDKARVHFEPAYPGGELPAAKAAAYQRLRGEFEAAGIATVDVLGALLAARAVDPTAELYYRGDSHWRPPAALLAAQATAAVVEARAGAEALGPRLAADLGPGHSVRVLGDLIGTAGFRAYEVEVPGLEFPAAVAASYLTSRLGDEKQYYSVVVRDGAAARPMAEFAAAARVLMAGTSFAGENGHGALELVLGRPVEIEITPGADGIRPLQTVLARAAAAPGRFRVLVWEIVERGFYTGQWRTFDWLDGQGR